MDPSHIWTNPPAGRPIIMGILNITPDSFSDGGRYLSMDKALEHAYGLIDQGADIIDIGGESTRPGADPVTADEELGRIIPIIRELSPTVDVPISVDTMKPTVAKESVRAGASIINDICGLGNEHMIDVAAAYDVPVVIMHMYGSPKTLATDVMEGDFMTGIKEFLDGRAECAVSKGVRERNIILDPGVGFGKTPDQNMHIIRNCGSFGQRYPVLIGPSRKRFLARCF
ncbi:MAG: dihydropteroate synthase, partial [Candidatus Methanoplasma sp.]|nr:dihydropteroate synthase [Candidatus Methanoplasma sp.]